MQEILRELAVDVIGLVRAGRGKEKAWSANALPEEADMPYRRFSFGAKTLLSSLQKICGRKEEFHWYLWLF